MKIKILAILLCFIASHVNGQSTTDYEQRLYSSYVDEKMMDWKDIMSDMKDSYLKGSDKELLYSLCFAQYGYIGYCISRDLDNEAKDYLKEAIKNSKKLESIYHGRHDILALQGALLGYKIMLSKFSALYLGPKAFKLIKTASKSSDKYFNCSLEFGNFRYYTPKFLGGSKEEAIGYYKNAVKLVESSSYKQEHNWLYINTNLFLAHAYSDTNKKYLACQIYNKILEYEPDANWIREEFNEKCKK